MRNYLDIDKIIREDREIYNFKKTLNNALRAWFGNRLKTYNAYVDKDGKLGIDVYIEINKKGFNRDYRKCRKFIMRYFEIAGKENKHVRTYLKDIKNCKIKFYGNSVLKEAYKVYCERSKMI